MIHATLGHTSAAHISGAEVSGKLNFGRFNAGVALFQIDKPNSFVDPATLIYGNYGTQRNRGVEITLDGESVDGLRIISGLTFNDAKLRRTAGGQNEGKDAVGVPDVPADANVGWDLPFAPPLTLVGRVVYSGKQAVDAANTLELGSWTRFDLGARYVALVSDTPLTLRFNVDNVADKRYWASAYNAFSLRLAAAPRRTAHLQGIGIDQILIHRPVSFGGGAPHLKSRHRVRPPLP